MSKKQQIEFLIVDNTAFASTFDVNLFAQNHSHSEVLLTNLVLEEATRTTRSRRTVEIAQMQNSLRIRDPSNPFMVRAKKFARKTGDLGALSEPDLSLVALALEVQSENPDKGVYVMSDDYSVQNVCAQCVPPINILTFTKEGIRETIVWEVYCPQCYKIYEPTDLNKKCTICNVKLKRRKQRE